MPVETSELDVHKFNLVRELFVDTADDNYILSRWSYKESLNVDFSWLAVHALEKYYKAALLMNGRSGKSFVDAAGRERPFGHNIVALHEQMKSFAEEFLPFAMIRPNGLDSHWLSESTDAFLARLYRDGNADNRYQLFGYAHHPGELYKLDRMVFAVRRLCTPLDAYYLGRFARASMPDPAHHFSHRDLLRRQPDYWDQIGGKLSDTINGRRGETLRDTVMHQNFAFAPAGSPPTTYQYRTSAHNSALYRNIFLPIEQGDKDSRDLAAELGEWLTSNVHLPRGVVTELTAAISGAIRP